MNPNQDDLNKTRIERVLCILDDEEAYLDLSEDQQYLELKKRKRLQ